MNLAIPPGILTYVVFALLIYVGFKIITGFFKR